MHLKQSLGDVIRQVIEEEHAMELMYNGQGGNRSICVGHLGFIMSLFFSSFLWLGAVDKRSASEGGIM